MLCEREPSANNGYVGTGKCSDKWDVNVESRMLTQLGGLDHGLEELGKITLLMRYV